MQNIDSHVTPVGLEEELKTSYLDYAMSVIIGRALPDVRDGLKPVHRRILFSMHELGLVSGKPHKKSARVIGDVTAKYHPHGPDSVYDAVVRLAQDFSLRYPLIDGQGNFGSVDGDSPAAFRYTEVRMATITQYLLADIDKETVEFSPNYDGAEMMPDVLPARFPNLLVNGSAGIAVGMATNIPPHNLGEVIAATIAALEDPTLTAEQLMTYLPGPDFPTGATICGSEGILQAYQSGRGRIVVRGIAHITRAAKEREAIIITELPYQVNKARLIEKIAELVKEKRLEGISSLRDESDREGMRIVIELKQGCIAEVLLNQLYQHTSLQLAFSVNMVVLVGGQPVLATLPQVLKEFIAHRRVVVSRRLRFECRKAKERAHLLEGLLIAMRHLDACIALIRDARSTADAKEQLMAARWEAGSILSTLQVHAILELRLHRLTSLEQEKVQTDFNELKATIERLEIILASAALLTQTVKEELQQMQKLSDGRRTRIESSLEVTPEDLVPNEAVVVTQSHRGYIKYQLLSEYEAQRRGGRGKTATSVKAEDFIENLLVTNTHDTLLCFSSRGRLYWLKVYQLPQAGRGARGRPIVNLLPLGPEERITTILPLPAKQENLNRYVVMATRNGIIKKTLLSDMSRPRSTGVVAVNLAADDTLIGVAFTRGDQEILLFSARGKVVRFSETQVRGMGRHAAGVRGILLTAKGDHLVSLVIPNSSDEIVTVTENGYGKRTALSEYPTYSRGTQGVISIKVTARNGLVVGALQVQVSDQMMLITSQGTLVRIRVEEVGCIGRNTQGVTLIRTDVDDTVVSVQRLVDDLSDQGSESAT